MTTMAHGERLTKAREALRLTKEEAAERIGVSRQSIHAWETDVSLPTRKHWVAIKDVLGIDLGIFGANEPASEYTVSDEKYAFVRKYAVAGGMGKGSETGHEEIDGRYAYRRDWLEKNKLLAGACVVIDAEGDSMYPSIHDGDTVLINTAQKHIVSGKVFAFRTDDGVRIKRLFKQMDGRVRVVSDNPDKMIYPDEFLTPGMTVDIIGLVVHRSGGV